MRAKPTYAVYYVGGAMPEIVADELHDMIDACQVADWWAVVSQLPRPKFLIAITKPAPLELTH